MKKILNIITPKTYNANGEQKTIWLKAGTMRVINSGEAFIEWSANPNVTYKVVEQNGREETEEENETTHAPRAP